MSRLWFQEGKRVGQDRAGRLGSYHKKVYKFIESTSSDLLAIFPRLLKKMIILRVFRVTSK
jgi:hypothetical protein